MASPAGSSEGGGRKLGDDSRTILETVSCPPELKSAHPTWRFEDFRVQRVLGEGAMSTVVLASCAATGLPVALKVYHRGRMGDLNVRQVAREIEIHAALLHPNVVRLYAAFEDADSIYLVQEFAPRGDLYIALTRRGGHMPEAYVVRSVLLPFLSALAYLHDQAVLHRDIKPENVMLGEDGEPRIGDFGLAINTARERPMSRVGTLDYMIVRLPGGGMPVPAAPAAAPEAAAADPPSSYGLPVDVWCVGILAYELLVGGPPFEAASKEATYTRILKTEPFLPSHLSAHARDFVLLALRKEPAARPTVPQLLRHPWLKSYRRPNSIHSVQPLQQQQQQQQQQPLASLPTDSAAAAAAAAAAASSEAPAGGAGAPPQPASPATPAPRAAPQGLALMSRAISFNSTIAKRFPAALPTTGSVAGAQQLKQARAAHLPAGARAGAGAAVVTAGGGGPEERGAAIPSFPGTNVEAFKPSLASAKAPTLVRVDADPGTGAPPSPSCPDGSEAAAAAGEAAPQPAEAGAEGGGFIKAGHRGEEPAVAVEGSGSGQQQQGITFMALLEQKLTAASQAAPAPGPQQGVAAGGGGIAAMEAPSLATLLAPAAGGLGRHFSGSRLLRAFGKKLSIGRGSSSSADLSPVGR